jgi:hypothetical protein
MIKMNIKHRNQTSLSLCHGNSCVLRELWRRVMHLAAVSCLQWLSSPNDSTQVHCSEARTRRRTGGLPDLLHCLAPPAPCNPARPARRLWCTDFHSCCRCERQARPAPCGRPSSRASPTTKIDGFPQLQLQYGPLLTTARTFLASLSCPPPPSESLPPPDKHNATIQTNWNNKQDQQCYSRCTTMHYKQEHNVKTIIK